MRFIFSEKVSAHRLVCKHTSAVICGKGIYGVWRLGCGQVNEMDEGVCLVSSLRGGWRGEGGGVSAWQGVCWRPYKTWRLQAWPRLFPTRLTFFSAGMRSRHLLQAETYNLGLSGLLSDRINWCTGLFSTVTAGGRIPAHAFLRNIPVPRGVSPVFYGSSAQGFCWGGIKLLLCIVPTETKTAASVWRIVLIPWVSKCQNADLQKIIKSEETDLCFCLFGVFT